MLQKTFSIYSDDLNDVELFVETGKNHISCWCKKTADNKMRAFELFQCDDVTAENFEELIENTKLSSRLLTMPVAGLHFFWNTDQVICVPKEKNEADFLQQNFQLLAGNLPDSSVFSKPTEPCTVAWRIQNKLQQIAERCFPNAVFGHQYVALLPSLLQQQNENRIYLFFYPNYFTLAAFKNNKLHYIHTIKYASPDDVLYFVLNVCKQYAIENNVDAGASGFIDENSKLYETLYQYLEGFRLLEANEEAFATAEFKEYALHHFLPYINYVV